jgi:EAL domain-containing protein (putative c-di-GMP-specific phosphodiesterase class I)
MGDLGRAVTRQSLAALGSSRDVLPDLSLWLNVDLLQLRDPSFADMLADELRASGIDATDIVLELSEADLLDVDEIEASIARLRAMGVRLAVDDFGTGYSSLRYLREFPVAVLKVDRSFTSQLGEDREVEVIVESIVGMARSLGLAVTAEGVETEAQAERLVELGCGYAQGYLYGRPVDVKTATELLLAQADVRA